MFFHRKDRVPTAAFAALILFLGLGLWSCSRELEIDRQSESNPWNHLNFNTEPDRFHFAIVSDLTGRERPGVFSHAVRMLNLMRPEFVVSIGDLIEGHTNNPSELQNDWNLFKEALRPLEMPFFFVAGNHDYYYRTTQNWDKKPEEYDMASVWQKNAGRSYYHFKYKDVLFLIVNACIPDKEQNERQFQYFAKVLGKSRARWTFVFFHYVLWRGKENLWTRIEPLLDGRAYTVFAGNDHHYVHFNRKDRDYVMLSVTGGMNRLRGPNYGEFDHIVWVSMAKEGPRLTNLMLNGLYDKKVVTEQADALRDKLLRRSPVSCSAILQKDSEFRRATARITLRNPGDVPLQLSCTFEPNGHLRSEPNVIQRVVPPGSEQIAELAISAAEPVPVHEVRPLVLLWHGAYKLPDQPSMSLDGKSRIVIDSAGERPRPRRILISDDFTGPSLHPAWIPLEEGGSFNGQGQYALNDKIRTAARLADGAEYTDGRGKYTLNALWHLPLKGLYRDLPPGTFESELGIKNIQWAGDNQRFRWEFWDEPDLAYHYGPFYKKAAVVQVYEEQGRRFIEVGTYANDTYTQMGRSELEGKPPSLKMRANWRESGNTWQFHYGINGSDATKLVSGGAFKLDGETSPEGKRNLIYVRQAQKKEGFSADLDYYRLSQ